MYYATITIPDSAFPLWMFAFLVPLFIYLVAAPSWVPLLFRRYEDPLLATDEEDEEATPTPLPSVKVRHPAARILVLGFCASFVLALGCPITDTDYRASVIMHQEVALVSAGFLTVAVQPQDAQLRSSFVGETLGNLQVTGHLENQGDGHYAVYLDHVTSLTPA